MSQIIIQYQLVSLNHLTTNITSPDPLRILSNYNIFAGSLPDGGIGNTSDSGSEDSRFEP